MIIRVGLSGLLALSLLLCQNLVLAAVSGLSITDRQLVSKQRVSRSVIDYTYTLTVHNAGAPLSGVVATVSSLSGSTVIQQAEVALGTLNSGSTQSTETFVLRQDRRVAFNPADLVYTFTADEPPAAALPTLSFEPIKVFRFSWTDVDTASHYKLLENPDGSSGFTQVGEDIPRGTESVGHVVPLYARINARYILQSCNATGCRDSAAVSVSGTLVGSIGYFKASNTGSGRYSGEEFGYTVSLSGDGEALAVGARLESSNATGVNGDQSNNSAYASGAVYVFIRSGGGWSQQAYIKASNTVGFYNEYDYGDLFGSSVSLSRDGNTLAVGAMNKTYGAGAAYVFTRNGDMWSQQAYIESSNADTGDGFGEVSLSGDGNTLVVGASNEQSNATGVDGDQGNFHPSWRSGAVYVFTHSEGAWSQQAYIKAHNAGPDDLFGAAVSLSEDGDTLAVGAMRESNNNFGAVYIFIRSGDVWSQQAYVKASNARGGDMFGNAVSLSGDGNTLAVGAFGSDSNNTGINNFQYSYWARVSGAAYVFIRDGGTWLQQAYIKASNTGKYDVFGAVVSLSWDGDTLAVGANSESSNATGVNGDQGDNSVQSSGAVYVFTRSGSAWFQQAYVKASNTESTRDLNGYADRFGMAISLSGDGDTLAVGAFGEDSNATGVNGDQSDNSMFHAGAVYLY